MDKILFVDDEPAVLDGYRRMLHREFEVDVACGGLEGLGSIQKRGPYSVVVSDMRMPGMNGAQFLAQVRQQTPDTVKMLLTGYTDLQAAMDAVNQGNIFRFLTKPCDKEVLVNALGAGLEQFHLVIAQKELIEKTLMGSVRVLTEVLSAASPDAFGRSMRIASYARNIVGKLVYASPWQVEVAASLSQLGCVTLDSEVLQRAYDGTKLTTQEQLRYDGHPQIAMGLLAHIPRLEAIAWMIGQQFAKEIPTVLTGELAANAEDTVRGAKIVKLAVAFDELRMKNVPDREAVLQLRGRQAEFDRELLDALSEIEPERATTELRKILVTKLKPGMLIEQEVRTHQGVLIICKGQEATPALIAKLHNFLDAGMIDREISAMVTV